MPQSFRIRLRGSSLISLSWDGYEMLPMLRVTWLPFWRNGKKPNLLQSTLINFSPLIELDLPKTNYPEIWILQKEI